MIQIFAFFGVYIISRFFSGFEDGRVSQTEIALSKCRTNVKDIKNQKLDTNRRKIWHRMGAIKLIFIAAAFGLAYSGIHYNAIFVMVAILNCQIIIFNPIIAVKYLDKHFVYLSPSGWDGAMKRIFGERVYYIINVVMFIGMIFLLLCIN